MVHDCVEQAHVWMPTERAAIGGEAKVRDSSCEPSSVEACGLEEYVAGLQVTMCDPQRVQVVEALWGQGGTSALVRGGGREDFGKDRAR